MNTTISGVKSSSTTFYSTGLQLSKSSSFSKFREAFESGNVDNLSDEDDSDDEALRRPATGVQAELEALRQNPRLQRMMMINGPRKPSLYDSQVNRSRDAIQCCREIYLIICNSCGSLPQMKI